jgi:hypothetical protein
MEKERSGTKQENQKSDSAGGTVTYQKKREITGWVLDGKQVLLHEASKKQLIKIIRTMYDSFNLSYARAKRDLDVARRKLNEYKQRESSLIDVNGKPLMKDT